MKLKLGCHISPNVVSDKFDEISGKLECLQIFLGRNTSFDINSEMPRFISRFGGEFKMYGHSPYILNICNVNHSMYEKSLAYLKEVAELASSGLKGYVCHLGKMFTKEQYEAGDYISSVFGNDSLKKALDHLLPMFERNKIMMLLENSAGNNIGSDMSALGYLIQVVREYNSPALRVCWDTEHSFANGDPAIDSIDSMIGLKREIGLIHLNAIEKGVEKGNHRDRHSTTLIQDCSIFPKEAYFKFIEKLSDISMILERDDLTYVMKDYEFITSHFGTT